MRLDDVVWNILDPDGVEQLTRDDFTISQQECGGGWVVHRTTPKKPVLLTPDSVLEMTVTFTLED